MQGLLKRMGAGLVLSAMPALLAAPVSLENGTRRVLWMQGELDMLRLNFHHFLKERLVRRNFAALETNFDVPLFPGERVELVEHEEDDFFAQDIQVVTSDKEPVLVLCFCKDYRLLEPGDPRLPKGGGTRNCLVTTLEVRKGKEPVAKGFAVAQSGLRDRVVISALDEDPEPEKGTAAPKAVAGPSEETKEPAPAAPATAEDRSA